MRRSRRHLAGLSDPEDPAGAGSELTTDVRIDDLPGVPRTAAAIAASWRSGGDDPPPAAPIGVSLDGVVEVDLVRDGPHALIAGTTGAGKSEVLRTLVVAMAARVSPDHVTFVLVDYKGGATFDACADLPHTVGVVTDLDDGLAARALVSLEAEVHRRERLLRQSGATDLAGHRAIGGSRRCHGSLSSSTSSPRSRSTSPTSSRRWSASPSGAGVSGCTSCSRRNDRRAWSTTTSGPTPTCDSRCACTTAPTPSTWSVIPLPQCCRGECQAGR